MLYRRGYQENFFIHNSLESLSTREEYKGTLKYNLNSKGVQRQYLISVFANARLYFCYAESVVLQLAKASYIYCRHELRQQVKYFASYKNRLLSCRVVKAPDVRNILLSSPDKIIIIIALKKCWSFNGILYCYKKRHATGLRMMLLFKLV